MKPNKIYTCARLKFNNEKDKTNVWEIASPSVLLNIENQKHFSFDKVFGVNSPTIKLFNEMVYPLTLDTLQGNTLSVLAYGGKGSGKTFTIHGSKLYPGIIPLLIDSLFQYINSNSGQYLIKCSYIEIYKDVINNLFTNTKSEVLFN